VRTISSSVPDDFKSWDGGPPSPKTLPLKPGLNRTSWDLSKDNISGVEGTYLFGGYTGSTVPPGNYTLRLTLGNESEEQSLGIKYDPRLQASEVDFKLQQEMLRRIEKSMLEISRTIDRSRAIRDQLNEKNKLMSDREDNDELVALAEKTAGSMDKWINKLIQPRHETFQDVINFESKLYAELNWLRLQVGSYDPKQTEGTKSRMKDLLHEWEILKTENERILHEEVGSFNELYSKAGLPAVIISQ
jgi:hypothetical protein